MHYNNDSTNYEEKQVSGVRKNPIPKLTYKEIRRFQLQIDKTGYGPDNKYYEYQGKPCWMWHGPKLTNGRAVFNIRRDGRNYGFIAARIAYFIKYGIDPGVNQICHRCDNPLCVNDEDHLFEGDSRGKKNMEDMSNKRRTRSRFPIHELTDSEVEYIRIQVASGKSSISNIAKEKGMHTYSISMIVSGETYPAAPGPITPLDPNWKENKIQRKIRHEDIPEIWRLFLDEEKSKTEIGKIFKVTDSAIRLILWGLKWKGDGIIALRDRGLTLEAGIILANNIKRGSSR